MEMQMSEKNLIDARSFQEIWKTLDKFQRQELSRKIQQSRACTTRQTIYNWAEGKTVPSLAIIRKKAAEAVGKYLNSKVYPQTLFPSK